MAKADTKLKQRIVGALVLTALAIVILPMLLDGSAKDRERVLSQIPDAPVILTENLKIDDVLSRMEALESESESRLPEANTNRDKSVATGSDKGSSDDPGRKSTVQEINDSLNLDKKGLPVAWSLQVGSFSNQKNALGLREKLRGDSHQSYIYKVKTDQGEIYRVFVGPILSKTVVEAVADKVKSDYDMKGRIVRYNTTDDKNLVGG